MQPKIFLKPMKKFLAFRFSSSEAVFANEFSLFQKKLDFVKKK